MHILELLLVIEWPEFLAQYLVVLALGVLAVRTCTAGWYDPAWIVVAAMSMGPTLLWHLSRDFDTGVSAHATYMLVGLAAFLAGIRAAGAVGMVPTAPRRRTQPISEETVGDLVTLCRSFNALLIALLVVRAATQGIPIFADDPELAKVEVNAGGFGLITRLQNPAVAVASGAAMLLWSLRLATGLRTSLALLPSAMALAATGSKSAFIVLFMSAVAATLIAASIRTSRPARRLGVVGGALLVTTIAYAMVVLLLRAIGTGEESALAFAVSTFGLRLLAFGDGAFYFFGNDLYRTIAFEFWSYPLDYVVVPLAGLLRIVDYELSLGLRISGELFGQELLGPNPTMFVEGYAYFGPIYGVLYCLIIGAVFQTIRCVAMASPARPEVWRIVLGVLGLHLGQVIAFDMLLFVSEAINAALLVGLAFAVVYVRRRLAESGRREMAVA